MDIDTWFAPMDLSDRGPSDFAAATEGDASTFAVTLDELTLGDKIGGGAFSEVRRGTYKGNEVAVKILKAEQDMSKYLASELAILA